MVIKKTALLMCLALIVASCGSSSKKQAKTSRSKSYAYSEKNRSSSDSDQTQDSIEDLIYSELSKRQQAILKKYRVPHASNVLGSSKFDIPVVVNDRVQKWIDYFNEGSGRKHYARYLARSTRFVPTQLRILKEVGVPRDLIFLSMMESGFNTHAYSSAAASGLWQFIKSTGKMYGLDSDFWVDERRDPEKASYAAARHLKDLYEEFGDWYLAFAAYNAGAGKVRRAIEATGSRNFWDLAASSYLRQETKDYVPKILAAAIIGKSLAKYGFDDVSFQDPIATEKVSLSTPADFVVLSECAGVDVNLMRLMNPELTRNMTPPNRPNYKLNVPRGVKRNFEQRFARLSPSDRLENVRYVAERGDTLKSIARANGISIDNVSRANPNVDRVSKGVALLLPKGFDNMPDFPASNTYPTDAKGVTLTALVTDSSEKPKPEKKSRKSNSKNALRTVVSNSSETTGDGELKLDWKQSNESAAPSSSSSTSGDSVVLASALVKEANSNSDVQSENTEAGENSAQNSPEDFKSALNDSSQVKVSEIEPASSVADETDSNALQAPDVEERILQALSKVQTSEAFAAEKSTENVAVNSSENADEGASSDNSENEESEKIIRFKKSGEESGKKASIKGKAGKAQYYVVKRGESLTAVASKYGVSVNDLKEWNNLGKRDSLWVNEKLMVKAPALLASKSKSKKTAQDTMIVYKVQKGDTLIKIAKRYSLTPQDIITLNNIDKKDHIRPGLVLKIPSKSPSKS